MRMETLGVSEVTVYRHLRSGKLPSFRLGGSIRVLEADLEAFVEEGKRRSVEKGRGHGLASLEMSFGQKMSAWFEITRPFSWTASVVPVLLGGAIAWNEGHWGSFDYFLFFFALLGALLLQIGTNVINELFDVRNEVDTLGSPRASVILLQGRLRQGEAYLGGMLIFGLATLIGAYFITIRWYPIFLIGAVGVLAGYFYTAPPLHLKYRAPGVPLVFFTMGPLMVLGTYYVMTGMFTLQAFVASLCVGILVAAILHSNDVRDVEDDRGAGFKTLSILIGQGAGGRLYTVMILSAYVLLLVLASLAILPLWSLVALLTAPLAVKAVVIMERGLRHGTYYLTTIDRTSAQIHMFFGVLLSAGFVVQGAVS